MAAVFTPGRHARASLTAALAVVLLATAGCAGSPVGSPPAGTTAPSLCEQDDDARAAVGAQISADLSAEFAASPTDEFSDFRALLASVCGKPVLQRYDKTSPDDTHDVASVTKSIISTLVGIAIADGVIAGVDQTLGQLLPEHTADMTRAVAAITLRQMLTMTAGLNPDRNANFGPWIDSADWVREILRAGSTGTGQFAYSSATSHLLAAILVRATGRPLLDYAREKLFDPLGVPTRPAAQLPLPRTTSPEYDQAGFAWIVDPQGIHFGAGWLKLRPTDLLKLGQLYLDGGQADGRRLLPAQWVHDATTAQVTTNSSYGGHYGYQWWITTTGADPAYAAVGFGGQLIQVTPARHLVVVVSTELTSDPTQIIRADSSRYQDIIGRLIAPRINP